jgi:hypothetical protein
MSIRQLRARLERLQARLERLQARFPKDDKESIARARYAYLHAKPWYEITVDERHEHEGLYWTLLPHLPPATTDEERAARARYIDLRRRAEALTEAEEIEFEELSPRYHFNWESVIFFRELAKKIRDERAEEDKRSRLQQLERQKKALAAAQTSSDDEPNYTLEDCVEEESVSLEQQRASQRQREAAVPRPRTDFEGDPDCSSIYEDDDDVW